MCAGYRHFINNNYKINFLSTGQNGFNDELSKMLRNTVYDKLNYLEYVFIWLRLYSTAFLSLCKKHICMHLLCTCLSAHMKGKKRSDHKQLLKMHVNARCELTDLELFTNDWITGLNSLIVSHDLHRIHLRK